MVNRNQLVIADVKNWLMKVNNVYLINSNYEKQEI